MVSTYIKLDPKEEAEMQAILESQPEYADVKQSELTYYGRVEAHAQAKAIVTVLEARGIALSDAARQEILRCIDPRLLDVWLKRAGVAPSADDVLKPAD